MTPVRSAVCLLTYGYCDPHNDKEFANYELLKHWMPVDFYCGGKEHLVGHLLYIHFYNDKRPHSVLMNRTPDKFESKYFNNNNKKTDFETEH